MNARLPQPTIPPLMEQSPPMSKLNRRQFSALAASAYMASTAPRMTQAQSPNEQLGVCIAGLNGRGGEHIRGFNADPRTVIRAIVDIDEEVAGKRADQISKLQNFKPEVFTDVRKALDADGVDILTCATPNHWHALMGVWAMEAGSKLLIKGQAAF